VNGKRKLEEMGFWLMLKGWYLYTYTANIYR